MFIVSTKKFKLRRADGTVFDIPKGYIGDIPDDIAGEWLIQQAIKEGSISTPASKADRSIDNAIIKSEADAKAAQEANEQAKATKKKAGK